MTNVELAQNSISAVMETREILTNTYNMISSLNINYLFFYVIGVIIGLILLVKLIEFILKNYSNVFYLVINGLVIASIYSIFTSFTFTSFNEFVIGLSLLIFGIFISYLSTYKL